MKTIKFIALTICVICSFSSFAQTSQSLPKLESVESVDVKVKGVGCADDIRMITENVEKLEGVTSCKTLKKGATTKFQIFMMPNKVSLDAIHDAIEDTPGCKNPKDRPYKVKS